MKAAHFRASLFLQLIFAALSHASEAKTPSYTCSLNLPEYGEKANLLKANGKTKQEAIINVISQCELVVEVDNRAICSSHAFNDAGETLHCRRSLTLTF